MKCILHVTVYAFCHVTFVLNLYFFNIFQCIGFTCEDTQSLNVACCLSLPQKKTLLLMNLVIDGVKCEDFCVVSVTFTKEGLNNRKKTFTLGPLRQTISEFTCCLAGTFKIMYNCLISGHVGVYLNFQYLLL